jgi:hypothetical protein
MAVVAALYSILGALLLKVFSRLAAKSTLPYISAYRINLWVTYLYFIAYLPGIFLAIIAIENLGFQPTMAFLASEGLMAILAFFISWIIYALCIYQDDTYDRIGFARGLPIALLNAVIFVPILLAVAFLNSRLG